jgi:cardiolipin synthase A/B
VRASRWFGFIFVLAAACSSAELATSPRGASESNPPGASCTGEACDEDGARGAASPDGGVTIDPSSGVTIQVQPSDDGAALLAAIRGAQKSVHVTIYLLTNNAIIDALADLKRAGKDVKVVLNKTFPSNSPENQAAFDSLTAKGVPVAWASTSYQYTHAKTIVIDGEKVIIMTMNLTFSSARTNREYIATDTDPRDVADCEKLFAADFANEPIQVDSQLVVSPASANKQGRPRDQLRALIDSATSSLDIEVQTLSDSTLVDAIIRAKTRNVAVRLVIDGDVSDSTAQVAVINKLKAASVPLRSMSTPDVHAKAVVVDGKRVFVGSQNFTSNALQNNREVGVITDAVSEAVKVRNTIAADFEAATAL